MSRQREWDSDYDVDEDEEPSSAESDDESYEEERPVTPRRRTGGRRPPARPVKKKKKKAGKRRRIVVEESSDSESEGDGPRFIYCALCGEDVHEDSFSAACKRGTYGKYMDEAFCLRHSAGDQRAYAADTGSLRESDRLAANLLARHGGHAPDDAPEYDDDAARDSPLDRAESILETGRGRLRGANRRLDLDVSSDSEEAFDDDDAKKEDAPLPSDDDDGDDGCFDAADECAICMGSLDEGERFTTACKHKYHARCVAEMAQSATFEGRDRCPLCRTPFPSIVAASLHGGPLPSRAASKAETAALKVGGEVQVAWETEDRDTGETSLDWFDAKLLRHLGAHGHVGLNVAEIPDKFLAARGFVIMYDDDAAERMCMLANDGLLFDSSEGISMHWRPKARPKKARRTIAALDDDA